MDEDKAKKIEIKVDIEHLIKRKDYTFYSNAAGVTRTETDVYIDFIQLPPEDNIVPSVRIYMAPNYAEKLLNALQNVLALFKEEKIKGKEEKK